ncbi:hypothetical protein CC1G_03305 [Coprinopsis cinerea okayama7|uniref:Rho-GAP domain-containing protein n=1 Tax=Coprinopsis cinerea (strain Okayama-7 / 130 / ATCC MYA-4618 / FGSC 9003) TaxID=240176 RepID=A8N7G2_COPC7|nr:hypothetical protein CC1G_03305 [Coprinopsis cinerea okayama7\|eukprot:XP_001830768.2 hypothetical protein CC1G_03305 [Coprinopsis cinerea okayama7\
MSKSTEHVTSTLHSQHSTLSLSSDSSNDDSSWSPATISTQPTVTEPSRTFISPPATPSGGDNKGGTGANRTSPDAHQTGPASTVTTANAVASLPLNTNNPSTISDAKSYTRSPDITTTSRTVALPPASAPSSAPSASSTSRSPPSPVLLRIDVASPAESIAPPAPPPKSPRHVTHGRPLPLPTASSSSSMGSGQSKPSHPPAATPSSVQQPQRSAPQQQQRLQKPHPQTVPGSPTHAIGSTSKNTPPPQLSAPSPSQTRVRSPSPQPSQTLPPRSQTLHPPAPIITSTSQAPSSASNGQPDTPVSMAGSFGSGASKFMRKIAGRRKKSEDATTLFGRQDGSLSQRPSNSQLGADAANNAWANVPGGMSHSQSPPQRQATAPPSTTSISGPPSGAKKHVPSPIGIPPVKPTAVVASPSALSPTPALGSTSGAANNRTSLITLSPGISSAVNFMRTLPSPSEEQSEANPIKEEHRTEETVAQPIASPVSAIPQSAPAGSATHPVSSPEKEVEREGKASNEAKETWRKSDSTIGHHTIRHNCNARTSRPVSMAESFQSAYTIVPSGGPGSIGGGNKRWSTLTADMEFGVMVEEDGEEVDEDPRAPRQPVPTSSATVGASSKTSSHTPCAKQQNRRSVSLNVGIMGSTAAEATPSYVYASGTSHDAAPLSHSISESGALSASATKTAYQLPPSGTTTENAAHPARAFPHQPYPIASQPGQSHPSQSRTSAVGGSRSSSLYNHGQHQPSSSPGHQASSNNLRGRLTAWTAGPTGNPGASQPSRNSTLPPPSSMPPMSNSTQSHGPPATRPTTISITNSLAPAAGLAKRAAEKLGGFGKKWGLSTSSSGSGYSSSASSRDAGSYWSSQSQVDHGHGAPLARTNSNQSSLASSMKSGHGSLSSSFGEIVHRVQLPSRDKKDRKKRRTPNAPSGAYSMTSSITSTSTSESDVFFPSNAPVLGVMMRGPLQTQQSGAPIGGVVFGRSLQTVVSQTRAVLSISKEKEPANRIEGDRERLVKDLEHRMLPALVVRCAQHLLLWGVQEEGLFRVSGRASHVLKLRSEFDTGVDYDMTSCSPGDLDPHAVASVFKAYLRELPEAILTHRLHPLFEAAVTQELETYPPTPAAPTKITTRAPGLPSNPRSGMNAPAMRKPPSLSTLAMPSFNGMPPASKTLLTKLRSLISQLPVENRDLIYTVVQLIKATYQASKDTKMPLSNLLLVFCPSLNMSPPLLKALCESPGIWDPIPEEEVIDIRRQTIVISAQNMEYNSQPAAEDGDEAEKQSLSSLPSEHPSEYYASVESSLVLDNPDKSQRPPVPTIYLDSLSHCSSSSLSSTQEVEVPASIPSPPPLSSSAESILTPTSSGHPSLSHLPLDAKGTLSRKSSTNDLPQIREGAPLVVCIEGHRKRSVPELVTDERVQFPASPPIPPSPSSIRRRSLALLSLPAFPSSTPSQDPTSPDSPGPGLRGKKPSLRRLFTKRSTASLSSSSSSANLSASAKARSSVPLQYSPGLATYTPPTPRSATDSSVSTPLSAVTAPQSSTSLLPPVLDMQIDAGESLAVDLGFELSDIPSPRFPLGTGGTETTFYASAVSSQVSVVTGGSSGGDDSRGPYTRQRNVSTASSNHLGLLDEVDAEEDDWTRSVLAAAGATKA